MKNETYYFEIKTLIAQFIDCFNDVIIRRYNAEREIQDRIHVNFVYASKTRTLHDIVNKAQHIKLPIISVFPNSITRDVNRVFNKHEGPYHPSLTHIAGFDHLLQPVPIDINIGMSIITRFQHDLDQILSNWIPYCDPYVVFSWKQPYSELEIRNIVNWSGQVSFNEPKDINHTQPYRWIADTSFTLQGWLFKKPEDAVGKIYKITTDFTSVSTIFNDYDLMELQDTPLTTETFIISARPFVPMINPYIYPANMDDRTFTIYGDMYDWVTNLYVSGSPGVFLTAPSAMDMSAVSGKYITYHDLFVDNIKLSAVYPGFSGIEVSNWNHKSNTEITFTMPSAVGSGKIDIIAMNEAGLGYLTTDAYRTPINPYPIEMPEHYTYVPYQYPWLSGVSVVEFE
jgi:hypothetical protein